MKPFATLLLLITGLTGFYAQTFNLPWQKETAVPATDIYNLSIIGNNIWVSDTNQVFYTGSQGTQWNVSQPLVPQPIGANDIILFNGRYYAGTYGSGVFVSSDNGASWQLFNNGLGSSDPVKFAIRNNELYVATGDVGIAKLNSAGTQWSAFNNGLASGGWNMGFNTLLNGPNGLIGSSGANGNVVVYNDAASTWNGYYLSGSIAAGLSTSDLIFTGNYLWAVTNNRVYASSDGGFTWTYVNAGMRNGTFNSGTQVLNSVYVAVNHNGICYLYKRSINESLANAWTPVDTLKNLYCYKIGYVNNRLYLASNKGLYYLDNSVTGMEKNGAGEWTLFPNPAGNSLTITQPRIDPGSEVAIYDLRGSIALRAVMTRAEEEIDLSALHPGLYFVQVSGIKGSVMRKKLVIAR